MKEVILKNVILGSGIPKICVPVTGRTEEEIFFRPVRQRRRNRICWSGGRMPGKD